MSGFLASTFDVGPNTLTGFLTLVATVATVIKLWMTDRKVTKAAVNSTTAAEQLTPNHGSSVADSVAALHSRLSGMETTLQSHTDSIAALTAASGNDKKGTAQS